jgi:PAS domain S-box-containing protein
VQTGSTPVLRIVISVAAVVAVVAVYGYAKRETATTEAVTLLIAVLVVSAAWGLRELSARARQEALNAERRHAEALREQANLLDLVHDAIFVRDLKSVIKYWNRGAEALYGWTAGEAAGKVSHELLKTVSSVPLDIETEVLRTGRWEGELVHARKDGTQVVVASRWSLRRDEQGAPAAILETNNDITERRRADEALRRQANLLDQTHDAILVWEFPGTILYWNRGAKWLYGFSRDDAIGRRSHELLRTEHPISTAVFEASIERHGFWSGELTQMTRDGRKIIVESRRHLIREADGRRLVMESNRDITERKRADESVRQAQAELAHMSRVTTMGELTASLAHELNQPIAAALTNANTCVRWLTRDQPDLEEAREAAMRIVKDATRATEIISRVRSFYRKGTLQRDLVDVNEVVREMLVLLRNEADRYSVSICTDLAEGLPRVTADRVQLQQVFMNLMLNGLEAMKNTAGELTIKSQQDPDGQLLISVSDTGVGLPAEKTDQIFNPFFTTKPEGTGMGLAITRSILESHGGRVWVTERPERGATFHFTLPCETEAV